MDYEVKQPVGNDEIDLIDVAVTIAESWRLLLVGPIVAGALTAAILSNLQPEYVSQTLVKVGWHANTVTEPSTLGPVINKLDLRSVYGPQMDSAIAKVAGRISVTNLDEQGDVGVVSITAKFPSPQTAHDVLSAVIDEIWGQSIPRGAEKEKLESELTALRTANAQLKKFADALQSGGDQLGTSLEVESKTRSFAILVSDLVEKENNANDIERKLRGLGPENIILPPTMPDRAAPKYVAAFSVIAAVATGLALLVVVFVRASLKRAETTPAGADKLRRLRNAFRLRKNRSA